MLRTRKYLISGIIFILGFSISLALYLSLQKTNSLKKAQIYSGIYNAVSISLQREIDININSLYALRANYMANGMLNYHQFSRFTEYYVSEIESIQALEWVPRITFDERDSFELAIQSLGFEDFEIFSLKNGERIRAEDRAVYYPVAYLTPFEPNVSALGFDPGSSNKIRENTINKAIETGEAAVSDVIGLIQKQDPHKAVLVFVPVFSETGELAGLVEGVYLTNELIQSAVDRLKFSETVEVSLLDERGTLIYGEDTQDFHNQHAGKVTFGDRNFQLRISYVDDLASSMFELRLLLSTCFIITIFLVGITFYALNRSEKQQKRSRANIESIFKVSENPIAIFDINLRLQEWNKSFNKLITFIQGNPPVLNMMIPDKLNLHKENLRSQILLGKQLKSTERVEIQNDDKHFVFNYLPIYEADHVIGFCALFQDITAIKKYEETLEGYSLKLEDLVEQRTKELDQSNKALLSRNKELSEALQELKSAQDELVQSRKMASLGVISAGVGHEINNPLNFIIGGVTVLEQALEGKLNTEQELAIRNIKIGAQRASSIVKTIGRFSRKSNSLDEYCDVHTILDGCLLMMSHDLRPKVEIEKEYCSDRVIVKGNEGMLHQAFLNILMNAFQSIEDQGKIGIHTYHDNGFVNIEISDSGVGIPSEHLDNIMDPFFSTKEPGKGVGLGLFLTYNIIRELKGEIQFESKPGTGTLCTISLKLESELQ
ncbi:CHASE domain-containing protein [Marinoscillum sp. MHG1-6]|uniref:CHASE domain-containing protein n=1 Tax=Marinoscillum sp. MHG1-6 TaxID=2959627 RepID=UPI0021587CC7|nr:CHASE domain-containing protein [Marinoscillum sp. MHG1-6]